ncbi:MAG: carbonic anhydrase [Lewinellaceae bacterium]|nr:carbonic anhydrase [Saprospiraceae bacterium]MCB9329710.1 carbonic anhydrase [Lewinellaceae bacterium]
MRTLTKELQDNLTPTDALQLLQNGNNRFVNNLKANRNLLQQVNETKEGQHPFAVILSCIDSRTSAELIFDQGLGDIFSARIAGNIVNNDILGSMEFACKVAGSKIVLVLGHTKCGAVKGACDHVELGNLTGLLHKIHPAMAKTPKPTNGTDPYAYANAVAVTNVHLVMDEIYQKSPILREMASNSEIAIVGGMYDVETGLVEFFEHPEFKGQIDADALNHI